MPIAAPKKKRTLTPLLTVVFLASYGLMTMLIVEQGKTIQAQRNLIQILQVDSRDLWAGRSKAQTDAASQARTQSHAQASTQAPMTQEQSPSVRTPSSQIPSTQTPSTQTPSTQTPSTQATPHHSPTRTGKMAKPQPQVPPMPASDLGDQRRVLITI
jgi:uncharacterized membrane protein